MARKLIGPKVQAAVPAHVAHYIKQRAVGQGVDEAVITRELVLAGHAALAGAETVDRTTLPERV
jgi:hypothetical protein